MLLDLVIDESQLLTAWKKVRENNGAPGSDGQTVKSFSRTLRSRLRKLRHSIVHSKYQPSPLLEVMIPKPDGSLRRLTIPCVRDRVLQTSMALTLGPILEREFEPSSWAYRPGRSVSMAIEKVMRYRDEGFRWVVDADIRTFFDEINHRHMLRQLGEILPDDSTIPLLKQWLSAVVKTSEGKRYLLTRGIPQGSPISPLLANLYLDPMDEALLQDDHKLVRYADDFLILCRRKKDAENALQKTADILSKLKLCIKQEKTRITSFDQGFRFLGVDFLRNLSTPVIEEAAPWLLPERHPGTRAPTNKPSTNETPRPDTRPGTSLTGTTHHGSDTAKYETIHYRSERVPIESDAPDSHFAQKHDNLVHYEENPTLTPLLRTLYVTEHGLSLRKEAERLLVCQGRLPLISVPLFKIDQVVVQGNQMVSTSLLQFASREGIQFNFIDNTGTPSLSLSNDRKQHITLHAAQFSLNNDVEFTCHVARELIGAKIQNSRVVLRRHNRRRNIAEVATAIAQMEKLESQLHSQRTLNAIRGTEGAAAHSYFQALHHLVAESWKFPGRRKRPPTDPLNVLLSYGYGVLHSTLLTLLVRQQLNPWLGHLHTSNGRHPSLVSDLIEPFRAPLVDTVALTALNNNLEPADFHYHPDSELPCQMKDATRKQYLQWLQNKLRSPISHPQTGSPIDYHRLMQQQAWHYASVVTDQKQKFRAWRNR